MTTGPPAQLVARWTVSRREIALAVAALLVVVASSPALVGRAGLDAEVRSWAQEHQRASVFAVLERITRVGDLRVAVLLVLVGLLVSRRGRTTGAAVLATVALAGLVVLVPTLQHLVARTGPTGVSPPAVSGAWPSGHAMSATVACLLVAGLGPWAVARPVTALLCAEGCALLVGVGLVYCDFHWLTDVVSGWGLAHLCVLGAAVCARWFGFDLSPRRSMT